MQVSFIRLDLRPLLSIQNVFKHQGMYVKDLTYVFQYSYFVKTVDIDPAHCICFSKTGCLLYMLYPLFINGLSVVIDEGYLHLFDLSLANMDK